MRKFFYDEDIDENEDLGSEERLNLDNPEEIEDNDGFEEQEDPDSQAQRELPASHRELPATGNEG